jgi:hypothetical protein
MNRHLYDKVRYIHGGEKKAYATTDPKEYFAEISEAYFGKNDFYPFTPGPALTLDRPGNLGRVPFA